MTAPLLQLDRLSVTFPGRSGVVAAVSDLSLELAANEVLALVGESGSGKSVTASAIAGLLPASARPAVGGSIRFDGAELLGLPARELNALRGNRIGTIFQNPGTSFDPSFTIGNQLIEYIRLHRTATRAQARDLAAHWLQKVGITDTTRVLNSHPHQLSGGMRQRVMIAVACLPEPDLLIADEPTTALDPTLATQILDLIDELRTELHVAVLLVTHDFGVVTRLSDKVAVLKAGRLVEQGSTRDVLTSPRDPYTQRLIASVPELGSPPIRQRQRSQSPADVAAATGVTKRYPQRGHQDFTAVHEVNLNIPAGRALGIIGESGSGKSTLARLIAGIEPVSSGSITITTGAGVVDIGRLTRTERARTVQLVFQDHGSALNPRIRVGDQIARPIQRLGVRRTAAEARQRSEELLSRVGMNPMLAQLYPHQLSGGQRQRVGIARALAVEPPLVVLDEPTSALDVTTQHEILELLNRLRDETPVTFVLIAHNLAVVEAFADDVVVLHHGAIVDRFVAHEFQSPQRDAVTQTLVDAVLPVRYTHDSAL